jgi:hypothetical protein
MHKADQPYIANQQDGKECDYLIAIVDGDAVAHTDQQDTKPSAYKEKVN